MIETEKFSWRKRARSFKYAFQGICQLVRNEHNARIHLVAATLATALGIWLEIAPMEWVAVVLCIALVLAGEAFNSAVESLCDKVSPRYDPLIGAAKDFGAAAVLFLALGAAVVGCIIFLPKLVEVMG